MSTIQVEATHLGWSIVHLIGDFSLDDVNQTTKTYHTLYDGGTRRVLIDARNTGTDLSILLQAQDELHQVLGKFEKISLLVDSAKSAFLLKVLANKNPKAKVSYSHSEATDWLKSL